MAGGDPAFLFGDPHRRRDPLRGDRVLVSAGRTDPEEAAERLGAIRSVES